MVTRRGFACFVALAGGSVLVVASGCAGGDMPVVAPTPAAAGAGAALLTPWLTLNGGWRAETPASPLPGPPAARVGPRVAFVLPVGVAARGDIVLVADAGARTLWRLDRARDSISPFAPFTGSVAEHGAAIVLGADFSAWVALPADAAVLQYDLRGRVLRSWRDPADLGRPVAIAVPDDRRELLVGDAATAEIVVFDPLGRARRLLAGRRGTPLQSIAAMSFGPAGLYVLDRLAQQVVVLGPQGEVVELIGENQLVQPRALAVDRSGRVFVSDDAGQRIKVFRGREQLASFGQSPGARFGRIEAMAVDANLLYVADSLNSRVHVLLIAPPSMERAASP